MGQVQAKEAFPDSRSPEIPLDCVQAKVISVSVDGLNRTKNDIVMETVKDLFSVGDFEELVLKSQHVRGKLQDLGCFSSVGVHIDTSKTGEKDYSVTFQVLNRAGRTIIALTLSWSYRWRRLRELQAP